MTAGFDLGPTDRLLATTRSVRRRLDLTRPVKREVVHLNRWRQKPGEIGATVAR